MYTIQFDQKAEEILGEKEAEVFLQNLREGKLATAMRSLVKITLPQFWELYGLVPGTERHEFHNHVMWAMQKYNKEKPAS